MEETGTENTSTYLEDMFSLDGRVALVTGGNGGLGLGMALGLGRAGAKVLIAARNGDKNAAAEGTLREEGIEAGSIKCDVTQSNDVRSAVALAVDKFGSLDVLINSAGVSRPAPANQITTKQWDEVLNVNLRGTLNCSQEAFRVMKGTKERPTKIINIGSTYSMFGGAFVAAYGASKGGVVQLTKSLAVEWARKHICVNAIMPGWFETDMTAPIRMVPDTIKTIIKRTPMGRLGQPKEVAGAAVFLASQASDFITGACLWVDGGYSSS